MTGGACWRCRAAVDGAGVRCAACGALQPEPAGTDLFAVLGLPRRAALDADELDGRWRERSREVHPDRHTRATPRERRIALERSARLNEAVRTLRDPLRRAEYLVSLLAPGVLEGERARPDPGFLGEQLEVRERLAEARGSGDAAVLERLAAAIRGRLVALEAEVSALLAVAADAEPDADALRRAARLLARARYHESALAEAAGRRRP